MPSRLRSRHPHAVLRALALAVAALGGAPALAEVPAPAMVAAQLGGIPTSPAFKMTVNRSETGAPEATAVGAKPIAYHASEAAGASGKAASGQTAESRAGKAGKPEKSDQVEKMGKATDKPAEKADKPARAEAEKAPEGRPAMADAGADPLEHLRQRLAEKLGARPATGNKFVMRVSNSGESGDNVITAVHAGKGTAAVARASRAAARGTALAASDADPTRSLLPTQWDYAGAGAPENWGRIPEFGQCATGQRQSPIDIRGGISVELEPIKFDYRTSAFSVIDDGHTVQVNVEPGNSITITGRRYELVQFHFHRPSEERIDGRQYDMVVHLVHKDAAGHVAMVAVLLDRGSVQPVVQAVWNNLPLEKHEEQHADVKIDLAQLLPADQRYYTYMGSLTTPPCTEGVLWMVMKQPVPISPEQVSIFAHLYPMNARPIQQADGRLIKQSTN